MPKKLLGAALRGVLPPILWRPCPPILPTPFFKFCTLPSLLPPTATSTVHSVVLFLWLNGWSHQIWCDILLNNMDVHMSSLRTLMHILCNKASSFIVCIGVSAPPPHPFKNTPPPLIFAKLPLKSRNCPSPPF